MYFQYIHSYAIKHNCIALDNDNNNEEWADSAGTWDYVWACGSVYADR